MASGHAVTTLVVYIISIFFVIHPVSIPSPHPRLRIPIDITTAPIFAITLLLATQSIDVAVIRNGTAGTEGVKPYNVLILLFCLAYMAITLGIAGTLRAAAFWVSNKSGENGWKLYFYFYILFTFVSVLVGNYPTVLSGTAFLVYYTGVATLDPRAWIMAEFSAANTASMVLFVGNPTNVVICEAFSLNNATFTAYTILPFLVCHVFCFATLAFQFRGRILRGFTPVPYRNPRPALRDPVGALVGSLLVGAMIILYLIQSFDIWVVSLPIVFTKILFDLGWDHYRYLIGEPIVVDEDLDDGSSTVEDSDSSHSSSLPTDMEQSQLSVVGLQPDAPTVDKLDPQSSPLPNADSKILWILTWSRSHMNTLQARLVERFPTFISALARLPFALIPFVFSQFILIEALYHQGWINVFGTWLIRASRKELHPTIWLIGSFGVILCNTSGTNIGPTILLAKVIRAAALPHDANRAAAIALAVASNIGAVSFMFPGSLSGLLWQAIPKRTGIPMKQRDFAFWNLLPLFVMTSMGLGMVSAEMAVLQSSS